MRPTTPADDHFFRIEVTVAACIEGPEGKVLGQNMVDATLGFSISMAHPPDGMSDAEINRNLTHHVSPVLAAIEVVLTSLGFAPLGTIAEPMNERSHPTGEIALSSPVRVHFAMPGPEGRA